MLRPYFPLKYHDFLLGSSQLIMTGQPRGTSGVALYSNGHWKYYQTEIFGLMVNCLSILSVNSIWGRIKYHKFLGKLGAIPAKVDRKCALKVRIARSAAFLRWIWGGTYWYPTPHSDFMMLFYSLLASTSNIWRSTSMLQSLSRCMMAPQARGLCFSARDLKGAVIIALESQ